MPGCVSAANTTHPQQRSGTCAGTGRLSPILGAFFLSELDEAFARSGLLYIRYMDDILVPAPTRWKLRAAVRRVNQILGALGLDTHPDKTFIGRIERGFDWLGYHISPAGLRLATRTIRNFVTRLTRLYEREAGRPAGAARLGQYVRRWLAWARGAIIGQADADRNPEVSAFVGGPAVAQAGRRADCGRRANRPAPLTAGRRPAHSPLLDAAIGRRFRTVRGRSPHRRLVRVISDAREKGGDGFSLRDVL